MSPSEKPFDETKYKALLDGLECIESTYSKLNTELRVDSEYYKKVYVNEEDRLSKYEMKALGDLAFITDGQHGYHELDITSKIHMLTAKNAKNSFADLLGADLIAKWVDDKNKRSSLKENDVILSTRGSVGYSALVKQEVLPANIDQDIARINLLTTIILPEFLISYFHSKYGFDWMNRNKTGMVQQGLSLDKVRSMLIPILSADFQIRIKSVIDKAYNLNILTQKKYNEAEALLGKQININLASSNSNNVKSLSDSFLQSGRLDAEYYQPKYDEYAAAVLKTGCNMYIREAFDPVREMCNRTKGRYYYIEIGDVDVGTGVASSNCIDTTDLPANAKILTQKGDIIVSTVRPNRGAVAILEEDDLLVSGAFTVLREKGGFKKEVLQVLLRTPMYRDWLLRYNVGTSYPVIKDEDVLNMPLPYVDDVTQEEIATKFQESCSLRKESKRLLDLAVKAVEKAIETDETTALQLLEQN